MPTINMCHPACAAYWEALLLNQYKTRVVTWPIFEELPIGLTDAYHHCRIDTETIENSPLDDEVVSADDYWLENIGIPGAVAWASGYVGYALATQTLEMVGTSFPALGYFELKVGPVQSIESIMYDDAVIAQAAYDAAYAAEFLISADEELADAAGDAAYAAALEQTIDPEDYVLNVWEWPNRIQLATGVDSWPTASGEYNSVRIRYVAGYTPAGDSPEGYVIDPRAKIGALLMLAHLYIHREDTSALNLSLIPNGARVFLDQVRKRSGFA